MNERIKGFVNDKVCEVLLDWTYESLLNTYSEKWYHIYITGTQNGIASIYIDKFQPAA
jgi:hypothetical protein